jgi:hypothetical protein
MKFNAQSKKVAQATEQSAQSQNVTATAPQMVELSQDALAMISGGGHADLQIGESRLPPWPPKSIWK